jgi:ERCC4-type nuclease
MISINVTKAKAIAHDKRREARAEEFKPHDEIIMKQIPGVDATAAEAARAAIRTKYSTMQTAIDEASTVDAIKSAMPK